MAVNCGVIIQGAGEAGICAACGLAQAGVSGVKAAGAVDARLGR